MSGRMSGSPPEKIITLKPARAISSIIFLPSSVESSKALASSASW